jgi:stage II sporulation protein AA (anti-sigma F factor antagonist)
MLSNVRVEVTGRRAVTVYLSGEIDHSSRDSLRETLLDARLAGVREIFVDLSAVTVLDSESLAVIFFAHQRMRSAGGRLVLRHAGPGVLRLLDVTNVADLIEVDDPGPRPPVLARAGSGVISVR